MIEFFSNAIIAVLLIGILVKVAKIFFDKG